MERGATVWETDSTGTTERVYAKDGTLLSENKLTPEQIAALAPQEEN